MVCSHSHKQWQRISQDLEQRCLDCGEVIDRDSLVGSYVFNPASLANQIDPAEERAWIEEESGHY